jgi:hypothetical protein
LKYINFLEKLFFSQILHTQQEARAKKAQRQSNILQADPMDIEAQRLIEEVTTTNILKFRNSFTELKLI